MRLTIDFDKKEVYLHDKCILHRLMTMLERIFGDDFSNIKIITHKDLDEVSNISTNNTLHYRKD
jgi:hypothetical protein